MTPLVCTLFTTTPKYNSLGIEYFENAGQCAIMHLLFLIKARGPLCLFFFGGTAAGGVIGAAEEGVAGNARGVGGPMCLAPMLYQAKMATNNQ